MSSDSTETTTVQPGPSPEKLLKLVKTLGVVMLLLFLLLIVGIIYKVSKRTPPPAAESIVMDLGINPASIKHLALDGDRLVLTSEKEILVVDIKQKKILLRSFATTP